MKTADYSGIITWIFKFLLDICKILTTVDIQIETKIEIFLPYSEISEAQLKFCFRLVLIHFVPFWEPLIFFEIFEKVGYIKKVEKTFLPSLGNSWGSVKKSEPFRSVSIFVQSEQKGSIDGRKNAGA